MAVREFADERGRKWRAWEIRPEEIHPATRSEDYLADCYITGWIVFETIEGDEKRRLCPWPMNWANETDAGLRYLLSRADPIPALKLASERRSADQVSPTPDLAPDITDLHVVRSFRYPGGRLWTVAVITYPEMGGPPVLRFTSGTRNIDLKTWPKDWADQPDDQLVFMLRKAAPRAPTPVTPGMPRRRWNDAPESRA